MEKQEKKIKNKAAYRGFSLLEGVLASFVLVIGMVAVIQLISTALKTSMDARDHQIAILLAQEGNELVRNLRDNCWTNSSPELKDCGPEFPQNTNHYCRIDYNSTDLESCDDDDFTKKILRYDNINRTHVHNSAFPATKYIRVVQLRYKRFQATGVEINSNRNMAESAVVTTIVYWGNAFPFDVSDEIGADNCNAANKCAFVTTYLSSWGTTI